MSLSNQCVGNQTGGGERNVPLGTEPSGKQSDFHDEVYLPFLTENDRISIISFWRDIVNSQTGAVRKENTAIFERKSKKRDKQEKMVIKGSDMGGKSDFL